jgi:hypothetical protein
MWQECSLRLQKLSLLESGGLGLFQQLKVWLHDDDFLVALTVALFLWLRWNSIIFGRELVLPHRSVCLL